MKTLLTLLFALMMFTGYAQVNFTGYLMDEEEQKIKNVTINLYSGNEVISSSNWSKKFEYDLELNKYYTLELVKNGYATKRIAISTFEGDKGAEPFLFVMELTKMKDGEEIDDFPSALIKYEKDEGNFDFDVKYAKNLKKNKKKGND